MKGVVIFLAALLYGSVALAGDGGLRGTDSGIVTKPSKYPVTETMDRMEEAAKSVGAKIFNRINYHDLAKTAGVTIRPNQLLIFGRGRGGPLIVKEAPLAGIDLPFKALVWEDAHGKVWLSYTNGSYIDKRYAVTGAADSVKGYDEIVEKIVTDALK
jgi:uncharacterized protein (DUF302 family)